MPVSIEQLNASQKAAVEWGEGPLLVLAGPGSGKTAVLTLRIAQLIENSPDESFRVLGLTFTVKAANEMQRRIRDLTGERSRRISLRTFHSFCADFLRQHGSHLGLKPNFSIITEEQDRLAILREMRDNGTLEIDNIEDVLKKIDVMFMRGITPEELPQELPEYCGGYQASACRALQDAFRGYLDGLVRENQLDFNAILHFTRELLESKKRIARQISTVYRYVCVDEFQDTNLAQYKVLRLIAPPRLANLFVVADDNQIIFQWNGADPKRLEELRCDYELKAIQLPENYRCPSEIVEVANRLIEHNPSLFSNSLRSVSQNPDKGVIDLKCFESLEDEIAGLISVIQKIPRNNLENCVVIARTNKLLTEVQKRMLAKGLNADIVNKQRDFVSPLIRLMYFTLKAANSPDSRSLLNRLCAVATDVSGVAVSARDVFAKARVEELSPLRVFFSLVGESSSDLKPFADKGRELLCDSLDYAGFVESCFAYFDELNERENDDFSDYPEEKKKWQEITRNIHHTHSERLGLHVFLQEMDLSPKSKTLSKNCVRLQTVHTAKGAEFDNVYVIGLAEDQFPTYYAAKREKEGDGSAILEERRNCFVAITRSAKNLYLSYARRYSGWSKEPSRFLREMGFSDSQLSAICHTQNY